MIKYDVEKNQKVIDAILKYSWIEGLLLFICISLAYLGYDLKLEKFTEFFACNSFVLFIWFICDALVIMIHYLIKRKQSKEKVGEQHENK